MIQIVKEKNGNQTKLKRRPHCHSELSGTYWAPAGSTREVELTLSDRVDEKKNLSFSSLHGATVTPPDESNMLDILAQLFDSRGVAGGVGDG